MRAIPYIAEDQNELFGDKWTLELFIGGWKNSLQAFPMLNIFCAPIRVCMIDLYCTGNSFYGSWTSTPTYYMTQVCAGAYYALLCNMP